jgi:hypothetical protein
MEFYERVSGARMHAAYPSLIVLASRFPYSSLLNC